jgi:hypothetical protein
MRNWQRPRLGEPGVSLWLFAQAEPDEEGHYHSTGHAMVIAAPDPHQAAALLILRLRWQGITTAVRGSLGHNVYETNQNGIIWFWRENPDDKILSPFAGLRAKGEGEYHVKIGSKR